MPLRHAHLDRETLRSLGLPNDVIDRTYRALYVYSVGAQNVIRDVYRNCHLADKPGRAKFSACIWMVFLYLLEHCEESEHTYTHMLHHVRDLYHTKLDACTSELETQTQSKQQAESRLMELDSVFRESVETAGMAREDARERMRRLELQVCTCVRMKFVAKPTLSTHVFL